MIVTEHQAKGMWCPHARAAAPFQFRDSEAAATCNRETNAEPYAGTTCLGSRCMSWRWHERNRRHPGRSHRGHRPPDSDPRWRADTSGSLDDESVAGIEALEKDMLARPGYYGRTPAAIDEIRYEWSIAGDAIPDTGFCGLAYSVRLP